MSDSQSPFTAAVLRSLGSAISYAFIVGVGFSLSLPLLSFALEQAGANNTMIGFNTAMAGLGTVAAGPLITKMAQRFGVERALYAALFLTALCLVGFSVVPPIWPWFPLRFLLGASLGVLFVLSEFWINAVAPDHRRSLILGIYATALSLGFAVGPQLLRLIGPDGAAPFWWGAAITLAGILPLILSHGLAPKLEAGHDGDGVWNMALAVPMASMAALIFGAVETGGFALLPLYGTALGRSIVESSNLISMVALGNLMFQVPLGLLADKLPRRAVLIGLALVGIGGSLLAVPLSAHGLWLDALLFVWGGITGGFYTVGLALLGERYQGADLASANASFVMMYSTGALAMPLLYGAAMDLYTPYGLMLAFAASFAVYLATPFIRPLRLK